MLGTLAACNGTDNTTKVPAGTQTQAQTEAPGETSAQTTSETPSEAPSETPTEPQAPELSGKLLIGLPGAYEVTNETVVQNFIDAHPNLEVEVDSGPWGDYVTKIQTQLASGIAPDVWFQENAVILGNGAKGAAKDLASLVNSELDKSLYSGSLFAAQTGDQIWGVPHDVNNIALAYNKTLFDEAGIDYPTDTWTYQDMYEAAQKLTQGENVSEKTWGYLYQGSITTGWFPFGKIYGGQILNEDKTKAVLDDNYWKGIEFAGKFVEEGLSPDSTLMGELGGARPLFGNGKAAMMFVQFSLVRLINDEFPDLAWDVAPIPLGMDGNRVVPNVTNSWMIYSQAEEESQNNAWAFLKHYLSPESQEIIAKAGTSIPDLISAQETLLQTIDTQDLKAFTEGIKSGVTLDENPSWNAWRGVVQKPSMDITNNIEELSDAMKQTAREETQAAIDTWNQENLP